MNAGTEVSMRELPMEGAMEGLMPRVASACTSPPVAQ